MTKVYTEEINICRDCPNYRYEQGKLWCIPSEFDRVAREIERPPYPEIPTWCPLPDKGDKEMTDDRYVCTKDNPWSKEKGRSLHPDAVYIRDKDYGDGENVSCYKCPNCGLYFEEEIGQ